MSSSIYVDAPAERVWKLIDEARYWPEWSTICVKVWGAPDEDGWQRGHRFGFLLRIGGRQIPFFVTITRVEAGKLIKWHSTKFTITAVRSISVESEGNGCRVTDSKCFSSYLLPIGLAYPRGIIRTMTESWLSEIKNEAESHE
ncbi:MAG TPA: hypothetical protein EYQ61_05410 [Dehalococcoidia bacterium]|jgi:uncharacterized membrane protein|nr:hypothetical protein [Dehalococcoidia bacterium]HIK88750.1 hypothetical protein [Dehalococcoidia bacterium]